MFEEQSNLNRTIFSLLNNWILFKNKAALSCKWGGESISELSFNRRHVGQLKFSSHTSDTSFLQTSPGNPSVISILVFCILWILRDFFLWLVSLLGTGQFAGQTDENQQREESNNKNRCSFFPCCMKIHFKWGVLFCHTNLQIQSTNFWNRHPVRAISA